MGTPAPSVDGTARAPSPSGVGVLFRLLALVPTAAVLAALGGLAYWGHETGWSFTGGKPEVIQGTPPAEELRPVVRFAPAAAGAGDLPLPGRNALVEFGSAREVEAAGIDIASVWPTKLTEQVTAGGEVTFDPARVARIPARAGGVTRQVYKAAGDSVKAGEILALIDSAEVGKLKAEFQQALVQARLREQIRDDLVGAKTAASPAAIREAEAALKEAEVRLLAASQTLTNLGLPVKPKDFRALTPKEATSRIRRAGIEDAADLDRAAITASLLPVRAAFAGVVLSADVVAGEVVEAGKALLVVVDPSRVWVNLHVGPEDARRVASGQPTFFRPDGSSAEYPGTVVAVGSAADEATRTVPVRVDVENARGELRASILGRGRIVLREVPKAVVVPHEAVHPFRGRTIVFVRDPEFLKPGGPKAFHARVVTTGGRDDRNTEIVRGLSPGEIVATKRSSALASELARASLGR